MKNAFLLPLKVIALTIILFVCFAVGGGVIGQQGSSQTPEQADTAAALLAVCFLDTVVLAHIILRSRWTSWRLIATVFFVFYGVMTFMSQIETAVFVTRLPPGMLHSLFLMGIVIAAPFSALAVVILGKRKTDTINTEFNTRLSCQKKNGRGNSQSSPSSISFCISRLAISLPGKTLRYVNIMAALTRAVSSRACRQSWRISLGSSPSRLCGRCCGWR